ncbi:glutathione S-transferase [Marinobacterium rhizophilum]|uniref:Glutathione S-transferase n=2 Tax=Marinobacterium rhizophilum TaxID=420402 RepID=A0ABY5HT18_9GAMM|nr:glutathione S-transferase [Marinobacterium rhizophilum]
MQLYYSPASPFVRKVLVVAHELGCSDQLELLNAAANPVQPDLRVAAFNPLGQVPTLVTQTGVVLCDSRVICEYLDSEACGNLFPGGEGRWSALVLQSHADGLLDAAVLTCYERIARPEALQWDDWEAGQMGKITRILDLLDKDIAALEGPDGPDAQRVDIGTIAVGCALGYLSFRFARFNWREGHAGLSAWFERFSQRPSMQQTAPRG